MPEAVRIRPVLGVTRLGRGTGFSARVQYLPVLAAAVSNTRGVMKLASDPLLRRSVCAAGQPDRTQMSRCIGLSGSDREFRR